MKLTNPFIGYITRSYLQIKQDVLTKFQGLVPEITDHTDTNPWVKAISVWASIAEMLGYYIDASAREVFITTATLFSSLVKIAKLFDYRIRGVLSASVDVRFYIDSAAAEDITIPQYTVIKTVDDIQFITTQQVVLLTGETEIIVSAVQQNKVSGVLLGSSDGSPEQIYQLEDGVVDNSIVINVSVNTFEPVDTFAYSYSDDRVFVASINENLLTEVTFGDDINGKIPASGQNIVADYSVSIGASGNVGPGTITQIVSAVTVPNGVILKVTNDLKASGGADIETIAGLKRKIPLSFRTMDRAVTRQDYIDTAILAPGVEQSGLDYDCGKTVDVYIVPSGGGIASSQLLSDTADFFDNRKMITTNVLIYPAGEIIITITAEIYVLPNYLRDIVLGDVQTALLNFMSSSNQEVGGSVRIGDLYEVMEGVTGVDYTNLNSVRPIPFARPINNSQTLNFTSFLKDTSSETIKWKIRVIDGSSYELSKSSSYISTYSFDQELDFEEVRFTVNSGSYTPGNEWQFVTYDYNSNVDLDEPSIPITNIQNLKLTAFGGIIS